MKPHLTSRTPKPAGKIAILLALFFLSTPLASRGISPVFPFLTIHKEFIGGGWVLVIDPQNVESFQLDLQFEPSLVSFSQLDYVSPYVQTTPPDLSMLPSGLLQDVAGTSSIFPPPPGHVDIFRVRFEDLSVGDGEFTVFASDNDFIVAVDIDTGARTTYRGPDITPLSITLPIPCPDSSSALINLGVLGFLALGARFRRMRIH